jgi:hypothetical protein
MKTTRFLGYLALICLQGSVVVCAQTPPLSVYPPRVKTNDAFGGLLEVPLINPERNELRRRIIAAHKAGQ